MSSNYRTGINVGTGTLREPDSEEYTINEGWDFFQKHLPDNSVVASEKFNIDALTVEGSGPYTISLPKYPGKYLNPSSLRLNGVCKIIAKKEGKQVDTLPTLPKAYPDPSGKRKLWMKYYPDTDPLAVAENAKQKTIMVDEDNFIPIKTYSLSADKTTLKEKTAIIKITDAPANVAGGTQPVVVPENLMCQAMWKEIEVKMNGHTVTKSANLEYAYKAYLETIMTYGEEALNTHMKSEMWYPDDARDIAQTVAENNAQTDAAKKRDNPYERDVYKFIPYHTKANLYARNKEFNFSMQLHTEITSIHSFLPDDISYEFKFIANDPKFFLRAVRGANLDGHEFHLQFTKLSLSGEYMVPSPQVEKQILKFRQNNDAVMRTTRTDIISKIINQGLNSFDYNDMFFSSDSLPDQLFIMLVSNDAKNGVLEKNPFYFDHYNVNSIRLQVNNRNYPVDTLRPDWDNDKYARTYRALFENTSIKNQNCGLSITPFNFKWGNTIFAFDLNPDGCSGAHANHVEQKGWASLHLLFKDPLPENVKCIVAGVYRDYIHINQWGVPNLLNYQGLTDVLKSRTGTIAMQH